MFKFLTLSLLIVIFSAFMLACARDTAGPAESPRPTPVPTPTPTFEEQKSLSIQIPYDDLFRNNEAHVGKQVWYEAKVIQVVDKGDSEYQLRANVTRGEYSWDDTVFLLYSGPRLLEGDIIEFLGEVEELISYEAVLGNKITIPAIRVISSKAAEPTAVPIATPLPTTVPIATPSPTAVLTPTPLPPGLTL